MRNDLQPPTIERAIMINATKDLGKDYCRPYLPGAVMGDDGAVLVDPEYIVQLMSNVRVSDDGTDGHRSTCTRHGR